MKKTETRAMVEGGFLVGIVVVLGVLGIYVPLFSLLGSLMIPATVALLTVRRGIRVSGPAVAASFALLALWQGPLVAFFQIATLGGLGLLIGIGHLRHWHPAKVLLLPAAIIGALDVAQLVAGFYLLNVDFVALWNNVMEQSEAQYLAFAQASNFDAAQLELIKNNLTLQRTYITYSLPSLFYIGSVILTYLACRVSSKLLERMQIHELIMPPIVEWRIPKMVIYLFVLSFVMLYWGYTRELTILSVIGVNVLALTYIALMAQGISCLTFLAKQYKLRTLTKTLVFLLIFWISPHSVVFFGIVDLLVNYRQWFNRGV